MKDNLLLDMYLAPHVPTLYTKIRNRALIQYFSPYMSADMRRMAEAFNTSVSALEDELMQLILDGQIQARIDSHNKVDFFLVNLIKNLLKCCCICFFFLYIRFCSPKMQTSVTARLKSPFTWAKSSRGGPDCWFSERPFYVIKFTLRYKFVIKFFSCNLSDR